MAEASISLSLKDLEDVTECAICHDVYTDPRSLPCIHTFCLECIAKWFKGKFPKDSVKCPICRKEFEIPANGLAELPKNIFIGKFLTVKELSITSVGRKLCDWCKHDTRLANETKTAKLYCIDCQDYLCENCTVRHSILPITRTHRTLVPAEGLNDVAESLSSKCDKHADNDLKKHCSDCKDTVCSVCFATQHSGHKARDSDVQNAVDDFKIKLNKNISNLADGLNKLDRSLMALQIRRSQIVDQAGKIEETVCQKAEQLKTLIDYQKDKLVSEVNQLKADKTKAVDNAISEVAQNKAMIETLIEYSQELLIKGSNIDITRESTSLNTRTEEMVKICEPDFFLSASEQIISFTPAEIISDTTSCVGVVTDAEPLYDEGQVRGRCSSPTLTHTIPAGNSVWSIAALGNELFVTAQCGMKVAVYDTLTFQQTRQIEIQHCEARGLATCSTNSCLYVSDWHANNIHNVSLASYSVTTSWSAAARPAALSVNRSHNLLVACNISSKIQEYSSDGSLIREISVSSRPWQAVERNDGLLCVTTQGPVRGVFVVSIDGEVIHSYESTTEGCGQTLPLRRPCSLAANEEGLVLVADHDDNKILVLNPTLTDACVLPLPSETITKPFSLYLDASCAKIYVGEFNTEKSRIQIFNNVFKSNPLLNDELSE